MPTPVFASTLSPAKSTPELIDQDVEHLGRLAAALAGQEADVRARLAERRAYRAHEGQETVERDAEIRRLSSRLSLLTSYGIDLCLGRMVPEQDPEPASEPTPAPTPEPTPDPVHTSTSPAPTPTPTTEPTIFVQSTPTLGQNRTKMAGSRTVPGDPIYIGRIGVLDEDGNPLLVDWRTPAAEPFFAATHANPMGLISRRRYRWTGPLISDYWDEVFSPDALSHEATLAASALDDQSSFIASLGAARTDTMRDVLATIAADQDTVIRADSRGPLVVSGGPGTGKTVVALHRAAYLMYTEPRLKDRRGGVLFVGPHHPYTTYISSVLPSLGEEEVQVTTLNDLVPISSPLSASTAASTTPSATPSPSPTSIERMIIDPFDAQRIDNHPFDEENVADQPTPDQLKGDARWSSAIDRAVAFYETPPTSPTSIDTPWADLTLTPDDWSEAFASLPVATAHNEALGLIAQTLADILVDQAAQLISDDSLDSLRTFLSRSTAIRREVARVWPTLEAEDIVSDLWEVPAFLRMAAPWLSPEERLALRAAPRTDGDAYPFTAADLPLIDAARFRLGDAESGTRDLARQAAVEQELEYRQRVADELIAADFDHEGLVQQLKQGDLKEALASDAALGVAEHAGDPLSGPFAHVIVDEAQELTDAQWHMLLRRCPSQSFTIVGDRAQARSGFHESWEERIARVGINNPRTATLTINYRTPAEVMEAAAPIIRAVLPDADVPTSIRSTGHPVTYAETSELGGLLAGWLSEHTEGTAAVIAPESQLATLRAGVDEGKVRESSRISWLTAMLAKGLEFDAVFLCGGAAQGVAGAVDTYVAMTRATQRLTVLH